MFCKYDLSPYLTELAKTYDRACPWCGAPLEIHSLKEIGMRNTSRNGLILCSNPDCDFVDYIFPDPRDETYFKRTGRLPIKGKIISFEDARAANRAKGDEARGE